MVEQFFITFFCQYDITYKNNNLTNNDLPSCIVGIKNLSLKTQVRPNDRLTHPQLSKLMTIKRKPLTYTAEFFYKYWLGIAPIVIILSLVVAVVLALNYYQLFILQPLIA